MYEAVTLGSEVILSAYPILIKKVSASLTAQTFFRMTTFTILALVSALLTGTPILQGTTLSNVLMPGLLNLIHVGSSYSAFDALPAGNAMALFYTYPVWNLLGAALAFKESIPSASIPWIGLAFLGAILLAQPTGTWSLWGVVAALLAAITETGIYLWFRKEPEAPDQPWTTMARMYGGSLLLLIPIIAVGFLAIGKLSGSAVSTMLLFNIIIGFVGYAMRFYTIPHVSTVAFSSISFFGIVAAYLLGWMFVGEVPSMTQGLGAVCITIANLFLLRKE
jgi:drug/metabolite transporter (DMT)-like permease